MLFRFLLLFLVLLSSPVSAVAGAVHRIQRVGHMDESVEREDATVGSNEVETEVLGDFGQDELGQEECWEFAEIIPEGEIDLLDDEYYLMDGDLSEEEGFCDGPSKQVLSLWNAMQVMLEKHGLTGPKLALQSGQESELLTQLLRELDAKVDYKIRGQILTHLYAWVERAVNELPLSKRMRGDSAPVIWQRAWDAEQCSPSAGDALLPANTVEVPVRGVRPRLVGKDDGSEEAFQVRQREDEQKLLTVQEELAELLLESRSPILDQLKQSSDPRRALLGIIGKTRLNTALKYLRHIRAFREWLLMERGYPWAKNVSDLVDYLFVLRDQPCRPTVPQTWFQALCWIYRKGGFEGELYLPGKSLVTENLGKLIADLGKSQAPTLQAARYPIGVLASLELMVTDAKEPPQKRIMAGSMLLRAWGTLRLDDLQHIRRGTLRVVGGVATTELCCTKTTGPGKRVRQLPVAISLEAELLSLGWLADFLSLLQDHLPKDRDYLLDMPTKDLQGTTDQRMTHPQATALSKKVLRDLRVPMLKAGKWVASDSRMVPHELEDLFSQHSGRAVLPSMSIHVEDDKSKRDCLGRWKPSASDDAFLFIGQCLW